MNKTIKIKAWDKSVGKMIIPRFLEQVPETGLWGGEKPEYMKNASLVFMQFTGILDKNKKEIYQGDIIRINNIFVGDAPLGGALISEKTLEVKWEKFGWYPFIKSTPKDQYIIESGEVKSPLNLFEPTYIEGCEIIGNIYETPNLLIK